MTTPQNSAKYAVIRLKHTDNIMALFQLLIRNGFGEVSFVNELNETIFSGSTTDQTTQTQITAAEGLEIPLHYQHVPCSQIESTSSHIPSTAEKSTTSGTLEVDVELHHLPQLRGVAILPTIPSTYLGLPTTPSPAPSVQYGPQFFSKPSDLLLSIPGPSSQPYSLSVSGHSLFTSTVPTLAATTHVSLPLYAHSSSTPTSGGSGAGSGVIQHSYKQKEVLNVSQLAHSSSDTLLSAGILPGSATTQLRQRGQRATISDDPSMFVVCRLCKNRIMGSRISNLTNHVRRHSTLKQFQCCYCDYTHNEMAKVRLHMLHNHKDKDSQPVDNINQEMQMAWDILMKECFPQHCQQSTGSASYGRPRRPWKHAGGASSDPSSEASTSKEVPMECASPSRSSVSSERKGDSPGNPTHTDCPDDEGCDIFPHGCSKGNCCIRKSAQCIECGENVEEKSRIEHVQKYHLQCRPFICSLCGYDHFEFRKVTLHIITKHRHDPSARVLTRDVEAMKQVLLPIYFPKDSNLQINLCHQNSADIVSISHSPDDSPSEIENRTPPGTAQAKEVSFERAFSVPKRKLSRLYNCRLCLKKVYGSSSMVQHARRHAVIKRYKCLKCIYSTTNYNRVSNHMRNKHEEEHEKPMLLK